MAYTYTYVPNGNLETGKPARATDIRSIRDMAPAIAEGSTGAPRIVWQARKHGVLGVGSDTGTSITTFIGLSAVERLRAYAAVAPDSGAPSGSYGVEVSFSSNGGSSWGSWYSIAGASRILIGESSISIPNYRILDFDRTISNAVSILGIPSVSVSVPSGFDAVRFRGNTLSTYSVVIEAVSAPG